MDAFGCDAFFKLVTDGAAQWKKILKLFQAVLQELESDAGKSAAAAGWDSALKRTRTAANAFCMLLDPEDMSRSVTDVVAVRNYKGDLTFEITLKSSLSAGKFWNGILDNILQTATATKVSADRLLELRSMLTCNADQVKLTDLETVISEIPGLRQTVRRGAMDKIETATRDVLKHHAITILNQGSPKEGDVDKVNVVLKGLPLFETKEGILDLLAKIKKWQAGNVDFMLASELADILRNLETKNLADLASFITKLLSKDRADMTVSQGDQLVRIIPQMLACAKQEARCRAVKIIVVLVCDRIDS